ncbi:hypothetical protein A2690_03275 [Candidatus Roizmanbacteria bacterium RIFCSPHIGHO2_01_FULL_39_12b]|uniref:Uncharacterized protein n=1 Tax=Candidatus Roizmanbacteria bacterium RIFCSPHIGHO2_01_FULL_39_12b TaxID=1802030 RepID=A0A1F7GC98_9BACT|nr:MAG: hypothetical protein A2690_03275 [Candidatus Roizmanbacteria bacterium RIFCSPHIGHO2_01_FULL_39_12b]
MRHTHIKIIEEIKEHFLDYSLLTALSLLTVLLLIYFQGSRFLQLSFFGLFAFIYILWGIIHHKKEKTLHHKVVVEYLLIAGCILMTLMILV